MESNLERVRRRSTADIRRRPVATNSRLYRCRRIRAPVPRSRAVRSSGRSAGRGVSTNGRLTARTLAVRVRRKPPSVRGSKSRSSSSRPLSFGHVSAQADTTDDRPGVVFYVPFSARTEPSPHSGEVCSVESFREHRITLLGVEFVSVVRTGRLARLSHASLYDELKNTLDGGSLGSCIDEERSQLR